MDVTDKRAIRLFTFTPLHSNNNVTLQKIDLLSSNHFQLLTAKYHKSFTYSQHIVPTLGKENKKKT
jgi:hypothetical protein